LAGQSEVIRTKLRIVFHQEEVKKVEFKFENHRIKTVWVLLAITVLVSCNREVVKQSQNAKKYENKLGDSTELYFPVVALADTIEKTQNPNDTAFINSFPQGIDGYVSHGINQWYSRQMKAMKLPIIKSPRNPVIRFTWLRTFHYPISVELKKNDSVVELTGIQMSGAGGYEPGEIDSIVKKSVSTSKWDSIEQEINRSSFWQMASKRKRSGTDGAEWILEVTGKTKYHFITQWCPTKNDAIRKIDLELVELAGFHIPTSDVY
jgi:hypothetical protein